jgi:glycerate kinase
LTDGGEGFVEILTSAAKGKFQSVEIKNSIGEVKQGTFGICEIENLPSAVSTSLGLPSTGKLGIVEMAQAAGLAELPQAERNPWKTSTFGVGEMLREAKFLGVDAILLGIGGSSTNDLGVGALAALGVNFYGKGKSHIVNPFPCYWQDIEKIDFDLLVDLPPLFIACDVDNPLLGKNGATSRYGPQKGLPTEEIELFEEKITQFQQLLSSKFPKVYQAAEYQGSGAAGGIGYGLSLPYKVSLIPGFSLVSDWFDFPMLVEKADLILTGEGRFDETSLSGKGPFELLCLANLKSTPSILLAGSIDFDKVNEVCQRFHECDLLQFGINEWSLEKNLSLAEECFTDTLRQYPFRSLSQSEN